DAAPDLEKWPGPLGGATDLLQEPLFVIAIIHLPDDAVEIVVMPLGAERLSHELFPGHRLAPRPSVAPTGAGESVGELLGKLVMRACDIGQHDRDAGADRVTRRTVVTEKQSGLDVRLAVLERKVGVGAGEIGLLRRRWLPKDGEAEVSPAPGAAHE